MEQNKKLLRISERLEKVAVQLELSFDAMLDEGDIDPRAFAESVKGRLRRDKIPFYTMSSDLAGIVKRLEVVTSRLEAVAGCGGGGTDGSVGEDSGYGVKQVGVKESAGGRKDVQVVLTPQVEKALKPAVQDYDAILSGVFAQVVTLSQQIGGDVSKQVEMVKQAFQAQREFILQVSKCREPSPEVLMKMLQPTAEQISAVQSFREGNRASKMFNHLSAFSEAIPALGWVTMNPKPAPYVKEMKDAGMFYTNRVLKDFKEKDNRHVEWATAWIKTLVQLHDYVKEHHTTGLSWNKAGVQATGAAPAKGPAPSAPSKGAAPKGGAPPPPPPGPPPPPPPPPADLTSGSGGGDEMSAAKLALFADLNKGTDITKGLKKVTADMQTHKNPGLRQTGPVAYKPGSGPKPYSKPTTTTTGPPKMALEGKKWSVPAKENPPVLELNGKKWNVEFHKDRKDLVITEANMKQTVYVYKCENVTLQIKGKVNSITLDSCKKVALVFDDVIAAVDFINCQRIQAQVIGKTPIFNVDKTDGCQIYLSKKSLDTEVVGAKYSELNILVPDDNGEFTEFAIAEQFKTVWDPKTKKMNTVPTEVVG